MHACCRMREAQAATQQATSAPMPQQQQQPAVQQQQQQPASKKQKSGAAAAAAPGAPPAAWKAGVGYGHRCADSPSCRPACLNRPSVQTPLSLLPVFAPPPLPASCCPWRLPACRAGGDSGAVWDAKKSEAVQAARDSELADVLEQLARQLTANLSDDGALAAWLPGCWERGSGSGVEAVLSPKFCCCSCWHMSQPAAHASTPIPCPACPALPCSCAR